MLYGLFQLLILFQLKQQVETKPLVLIGLFRQKYPDVSVQLQVHSTRRTGWSVANGQIDLAIIGGQLPGDLENLLQVIPYATDELALVLPTKHPLSQKKELLKEDLYKLNFVTLDSQSTTRKVVDKLLALIHISEPTRL